MYNWNKKKRIKRIVDLFGEREKSVGGGYTKLKRKRQKSKVGLWDRSIFSKRSYKKKGIFSKRGITRLMPKKMKPERVVYSQNVGKLKLFFFVKTRLILFKYI